MTTRRAFIGTLAGGLLAAPLAAEAQPVAKVYRIGLLGGTPPTAEPRLWEGFFQEMRERGYVEGRNVIYDGRWYGDQPERLPALAAELVQLKVDIIVAGAAPAPEAAQRATSTIPIVMAYHADPVGVGLVSSLASPAGKGCASSGGSRARTSSSSIDSRRAVSTGCPISPPRW